MLKEDMSFVGPRPLFMDRLLYITPKQNKQHEVMPCTTGWARVNGPNALGREEKIEWLTRAKVWKRDGIQHGDALCMPRFDQ